MEQGLLQAFGKAPCHRRLGWSPVHLLRGRPYDGRVRTRTRPCLTLHIRLLTGHALQLINSRPRFFSPFTFSNFFSGALLHADGCQEHSELEEEASSAAPPPSAPPAKEDFFVAPSATKTCISPITFSKTRMENAGSGSRCLESVDLPPREYFLALESAGGAGGHYRISSRLAGPPRPPRPVSRPGSKGVAGAALLLRGCPRRPPKFYVRFAVVQRGPGGWNKQEMPI